MKATALFIPTSKLKFFEKSCISGAVYALSTLVLFQLSQYLKLTTSQQNPFVTLIFGFIGGTVLSIVLGFLSLNFRYSKTARFILIFAILSVIGYLSNIVEYIFFSTITLSDLYYEITYMLIVYALTTAIITYLFSSGQETIPLTTQLQKFFSTHSASWWALKIFIVAVLYLPIYLFFGALFSPIIVPFYTDPSYGLELIIPPFEIIIPLEIVRGLFYVILLIPVIASIELNTRKQGLLLAAILFCVGALPGLLSNHSWPILLRLAHGVEIALDSIVYGYVISKVLNKT